MDFDLDTKSFDASFDHSTLEIFMTIDKRAVSATLASFLCTLAIGCGQGDAPQAGVLDPGTKAGMSPVNKSGEAKPAAGKEAPAK
ncbi:MAG: hypothetical protein DWI24_11330 [Planctomycetota bacterium]|nr:MAG: hypothetical protein DWI24_11330 [Planctomycetota bacterium]